MSHDTPPPSEPHGQPTPTPKPAAKGFFGALFDVSFEHFVTPVLVKVVYILAMVALGIFFLVWLVAGFAQDLSLGLVVLLAGPILALVYLALIRMTLEFYLSVVRMSQDIHQRLPR